MSTTPVEPPNIQCTEGPRTGIAHAAFGYAPDPSYWTLRLLAALGIAWNLREVPAHALEERKQRLRSRAFG